MKTAREGNDIIDEWFGKAKQMQREFSFEPTALDSMATQRRPVRYRYQMEDLSIEDENTFKTSFVYPIVDITLSKLLLLFFRAFI